MNIILSEKGLAEVEADVLIIPVIEGDSHTSGFLSDLNSSTGGLVANLFENGELEASRNQGVMFFAASSLATKRLMFLEIGKDESMNLVALQRAAGTAIRVLSTS